MTRQRAAAIIEREGRLLLVHRLREGRDYYVFPGGGVEAGESFQQACRREVQEETGLDVIDLRLAFSIGQADGDERYYRIVAQGNALRLGGPEQARASEDNRYLLEWIPLERVPALDLLPDEAKRRCLADLAAQG